MPKFECSKCCNGKDPCVLSYEEGEDEPRHCPLYEIDPNWEEKK
jgi:hypothetical protein